MLLLIATLLAQWSLVFSGGSLALLLAYIPMSLTYRFRLRAAKGLNSSAYCIGASVWLWSFIIVLEHWGLWAIVIGVLLAGVGVVPIAVLALLTQGLWGPALAIVAGVAITWGHRVWAGYLRFHLTPPANA